MQLAAQAVTQSVGKQQMQACFVDGRAVVDKAGDLAVEPKACGGQWFPV